MPKAVYFLLSTDGKTGIATLKHVSEQQYFADKEHTTSWVFDDVNMYRTLGVSAVMVASNAEMFTDEWEAWGITAVKFVYRMYLKGGL